MLIPQRKIERQVKVLIKNLAIFFLFPSKQSLPISFKFSCGKLLPKTEGTMLEDNDYANTGIFQAQQFNLYFAKFVCLLCH
jgi:hypothetical protein